jgi:hypothetical protein
MYQGRNMATNMHKRHKEVCIEITRKGENNFENKKVQTTTWGPYLVFGNMVRSPNMEALRS